MNIPIDPELRRDIKRLFAKIFPAAATKGILEIYSRDGYADYPMRFVDESGMTVKREFKGWDSPDMVAEGQLTLLLGTLLDMKKGLAKGDDNYWNHFLYVLDNGNEQICEFSYHYELDVQHEEKIRASIGDELYEKYECERLANARSSHDGSLKSNDSDYDDSDKTAGSNQYSIQDLLSFIVEELGQDMPSDWEELIVKAEVFVENGKQAVSTVNYFISPDNKTPKRFVPTHAIGTMNAVARIQREMSEQGKAWRSATFTINRDGDVNIETDI